MKYHIWDIEWFRPVDWPKDAMDDVPTEISKAEIDTDDGHYNTGWAIRKWLNTKYGGPTATVKSCLYEPADPDTKVFTVCVKRTDALFVNVWAKTLDEAIKRVERRAECNDWFASWHWDGEGVEVSREDSHEAPNEDADF